MEQTKTIIAQAQQLQDDQTIPRDQIIILIADLKKEHQYACALHQDTKEYLDMLGILPNMLADDKFKSIYEGTLPNPFSRTYESLLEKQGLSMVRDCLSDFRRMHDQPGYIVDSRNIGPLSS